MVGVPTMAILCRVEDVLAHIPGYIGLRISSQQVSALGTSIPSSCYNTLSYLSRFYYEDDMLLGLLATVNCPDKRSQNAPKTQ